jgi:P-type E1-E2 ATPase
MIEIEIPGYQHLSIAHVVLDVNGTLAIDGRLLPGVKPRLDALREIVAVHMLTADTHGKQATIDAQLGFSAHIIQRGTIEKTEYVRELGAETVMAMGNGANDAGMVQAAALGVAVLGPEGLSTALLQVADVLVIDAVDGLDLLLKPGRLRGTLRR